MENYEKREAEKRICGIKNAAGIKCYCVDCAEYDAPSNQKEYATEAERNCAVNMSVLGKCDCSNCTK